MPPRTIAIGDIHGCDRALETLLEALSPSEADHIIPLGDFVDRGPDSKRVVDLMLQLEKQCRVEPIMGNHEEMMLAVIREETPPADWLRYGGVQTLESYGFSGDLGVIPESHRDFFNRCLDYVETDTHFFVHANYLHDVPLSEQDFYTLRWQSLAAAMPAPHQNGKIAVVGHTPDKFGEIMDVGYLKCIDTYCYGGMWLTALDIQSQQVWQANQEGQLRN